MLQCEGCNEYQITSLEKLSEVCPHCKSEMELSILNLGIKDNELLLQYIHQEV